MIFVVRSESTTGAPVTTYCPPFCSAKSFISTASRTLRDRGLALAVAEARACSRTWISDDFALGNR